MSFLSFKDEETDLHIYNSLFNKIQNFRFNNTFTKGDRCVKPKIFCIDGNIGSGKSTILDEIKHRGYIVYKENMEEWMPLLTLFYDNPKRWMFTLQVQIMMSMKKQYDDIYDKVSEPFVFIERSPLSTLLFVKNGIRNGYLTVEETEVFTKIFNKNFWAPDKVFYVDTPVDICFSRSQKRARQCEKSIQIKYLQQLHDEYKNMYTSSYFTDTRRTDGTRSVKTTTDEILEHIANIL